MEKVKVSVYITTHNRKDKAKIAIDSVLAQTYENIEIILSDDGSTDDTPKLAYDYLSKYDNFKYVRNDVPKGANVARNNALDVASGYFITGLDDDDIFRPDRVKSLVESWDDSCSLVCDNLLNKKGSKSWRQFKQKRGCVNIQLKSLLIRNLCTNQILTKTSYLRKINGFDESLKKLQDWECWIRLVNHYGPAKRINKSTYIMFHHQGPRVTDSQGLLTSYEIIVRANIEIFNRVLGKKYVSKFILRTKVPRIWDYFIYARTIPYKSELKRFFKKS